MSRPARLLLLMLALIFIAPALFAQPDKSTSTKTKPAMQLTQIDFAVTKIDAMVKFYESVFETSFTPFDAGGVKLYSGVVCGMKLLMAPNSIAGVVAEQSRHQFEVLTPDFDGVVARAKAAAGTIRPEQTPDGAPRIVTIVDPDGNTTVFTEQK